MEELSSHCSLNIRKCHILFCTVKCSCFLKGWLFCLRVTIAFHQALECFGYLVILGCFLVLWEDLCHLLQAVRVCCFCGYIVSASHRAPPGRLAHCASLKMSSADGLWGGSYQGILSHCPEPQVTLEYDGSLYFCLGRSCCLFKLSSLLCLPQGLGWL